MRIVRVSLFVMLAVLFTVGMVGCDGANEQPPEPKVEDPQTPTEETPVETPTTDEPPALEGEAVTYTMTLDSGFQFTGHKKTAGFIEGQHSGSFNDFNGTVVVYDGDLEKMEITYTVDTTTMWTDDDYLTKVLKGDKFFDTENYPSAVFKSTSVKKVDEGYEVTGDLTLKDVTKPVTFVADVELKGTTLTAASQFQIDKNDFGWDYNGPLPGLTIQPGIDLEFDIIAEAE